MSDHVTPNFKRPRSPKKREPKARDSRPGMSEPYLAAIRRLPSCISWRRPCEAHHLRCAGGRGVSLKAEDRWALPLTRDEHRQVHTRGSKHEFEWFKERRGINCLDLAAALWSAFPDEKKMLLVLNAHFLQAHRRDTCGNR